VLKQRVVTVFTCMLHCNAYTDTHIYIHAHTHVRTASRAARPATFVSRPRGPTLCVAAAAAYCESVALAALRSVSPSHRTVTVTRPPHHHSSREP